MIFPGKHLCWGFSFIKVAGLHASNYVNKGLQHRYFLFNIGKFLGSVLHEKVFLEISQNSQENTCARVIFLIKSQTEAGAYNFINKETLAQVFSCEFCKISKNTLLTEHLWATASEEHLRMTASAFLERTFFTS